MRALMTTWAPWTFTFNITRQPAITMPLGARGDGLPTSVQTRVESGELSFGHARTLLAFEHAEEIERAAQRIAALSLSVRQTESYVQGLLHPEKATKKSAKPEPPVDPNVREAQEQLQRSLGLKVTIEDHHGRGKVIIEYARLEDFDKLLEQLAGD